jgi:hypothetical protein
MGWPKPRVNNYAILCIFESVPEHDSVRLSQTTEAGSNFDRIKQHIKS